ncbi:MAG: hypothetical protein K5872_16315 [Rhizobiaceae bacterium]|nr:hypothetical protein [Rhizobiaceae bacterium]MCV0407786.1 hypothetical protein [Rhizobiaceae bacterium]
MSEPGKSFGRDEPLRSLADAIRDVKNAAADRDDVVVEMRDAARGRLDLLAAELEPVFADVPRDDPTFDFAISSGLQPRLWIDAVAHVAMGRDKRVYRFVRDTRLGRVVLAETTDMKAVADAVTRYVAERVIERTRMLDGEATPLPRGEEPKTRIARPAASGEGWRQFAAGLALVLAGAVAGALLVLALVWEKLAAAGTGL